MKSLKWLSALSIVPLSLTSVSFCLVSCGTKKPEPTPTPTPSEEVEEFISDRTFSLMATPLYRSTNPPYELVTSGISFGTGWIIDDFTPIAPNDYQYYIATNWHVTRGFDLLNEQDIEGYEYLYTIYCFADASNATSEDGIIDIYDYCLFNNGPEEHNYIQEDTPISKYIFDDTPQRLGGIDFHVCQVNFANATDAIRAKLDKLNAYRQEHGYINQFANSDDESVIKQTKYIGGYPFKFNEEQFGSKWEAHTINASALSYNPRGRETHYIDQEHSQEFKYYDCSAQYVTNDNFGTDWMTGGASGSMLLTEDLKICGIYWGGIVDDPTTPTWFKPRFSLLKTSQYDFIAKWIKK